MPLAFSLRIAFASDHAGFSLKKSLISKLSVRGHDVYDIGTHDEENVDYPEYADMCCNRILTNFSDLGVLICGTGIGMSIAANRHKGIRCALVTEPLSAEFSRNHNDSNVLALGSRIIGEEMAWKCLITWLTTPFDGGRHIERVNKLG
jgi:ribose 5-phosphate isomerase B